MQPPDDYNAFCESECVEPGATASKMPGGLLESSLQLLNAPDLPEAAVARLTIEDALALRTQLATGKASLEQTSAQDIETQQLRWRGSSESLEPGTKSYMHRQRLALELRYREQNKHKAQVWE